MRPNGQKTPRPLQSGWSIPIAFNDYHNLIDVSLRDKRPNP
jgi:hypothetical protein